MAESQSNRAAARMKPAKPYPSFPLYAHASGKWAKKVKGRVFYFGGWDDPQEALREYQRWVDANHGNQSPSTTSRGSLTIADLVNSFLAAKDAQLASKEIARRTFTSYLATGKLVTEYFGRNRHVASLRPMDFSELRADIAQRLNPIGVGNEVTRVKAIFHWGIACELIDPVRFGPEFRRPPKATIRRHKRDNPRSLFTVAELQRLMAAANSHMQAMMLMGLNCGFNNMDCADLRLDDVNLEIAWVQAPRKKTAVNRKCPLWPETVNSLRESLATRPEPRTQVSHARFFVRPNGSAYDESAENNVTREFTALCQSINLHEGGRSFYTLRHHFATWAGESRDVDAVCIIMGHERDEIREGYRHHFPESRLVAVTDIVRQRLFGGSANDA